MRHSTLAVLTALALGLGGWGLTRLSAGRAADAGGVTVGTVRVAAHDRAIERSWLRGEAAERRLRPDPVLGRLRAQVADALAGARPGRDPRRFARAFEAFHRRWRSRTRCAQAYRDPYADRCGNRARAAAGTCRWMGEATVCALDGERRDRWLVVQDASSARRSWPGARGLPRRLASRAGHARTRAGSRSVRLRSHADALKLALAVYQSARSQRDTAARAARLARAAVGAAQAATARLELRERERAKRARDPRLSAPALSSARAACARQVAASDPYVFGFGMQDVAGAAEGLIAARGALAGRLLDSARDVFDRRKLQPLARAVATGNRDLGRLAAAAEGGDDAGAAELLTRFDADTTHERALARSLALGDCLVRPSR